MFYKDNEKNLKYTIEKFHSYYTHQLLNDPKLPIGVAVDDFIAYEKEQEAQWYEIHESLKKTESENRLLLKGIKVKKSRRFYNHLLNLVKYLEAQWDIPMTFVTTPEGDYQEENEFGRSIKGIYVQQKCFEDSCAGTVCVEIYPGQYLRFCFAT